MNPADLPSRVTTFLTERHLATLTTPHPGGGPHVVPVGFTWDGEQGLARVISSGGSVKVRNVLSADVGDGASVAICQVDGRRWLTLEGRGRVSTDPADIADAERRYAARYRQPRPNPERVVILIRVYRLIGAPEQT